MTSYLNQSIKEYLNELSSENPVPGGGGTSALAASLGIALEIMVARIAIRKLEGARKKRLEKIIGLLEKMRADSQEIIDIDPNVYGEVMAAYKRARGAADPEKAQTDIEAALANSFRLQADLALLIAMAKELLSEVGGFAKGSIRNDLIVSSALLDGAFQGAVATARINVVYLKDGAKKRHFEGALQKLQQKYKKVKFT